MRIKKLLGTLLVVMLLSACNSSKQISYFQDTEYRKSIEIAKEQEITIKPKDKLSIIVNSKDPLLANLFNLPIVTHRIGATNASYSQSQQVSCYTVDNEGNIDFPVLGKLHIEGRNKEEIATLIKNKLISQNLVNDPIVTVEYANLYVSILGEVNRPGQYEINYDKFTLLDALGKAGDLTINGKRNNVTVLREVNGKQEVYHVDLTSARDVYSSPAYYLQQRDVIYVEPNGKRARQATVNGNNIRSTSFWFSIASLLTSIAVLLSK